MKLFNSIKLWFAKFFSERVDKHYNITRLQAIEVWLLVHFVLFIISIIVVGMLVLLAMGVQGVNDLIKLLC